MESAEKFLLVVCITVAFNAVIANPAMCSAFHLGGKCYGEWGGEFFPGIPSIKYEGPSTKNPLAFKWYNPEEVILGKKMKVIVAVYGSSTSIGLLLRVPEVIHLEQLRRFGRGKTVPTLWPWPKGELGVNCWCFHDRDIAPDGATLKEANKNLDEVVQLAKELQQGTDIKPLWGSAQLFMHPRYMHGGATRSLTIWEEKTMFSGAAVKGIGLF